jgi:lactoylglutathione lyase
MIRYGLSILTLGFLLAGPGFADDAPDPDPKSMMMFVSVNVLDLERSLAFYEGILGMQEFTRYEHENLTEVVLSFTRSDPTQPPPDRSSMLVLMHHHDRREPYAHGESFSRIAFGVSDVEALVEAVRTAGLEVTREPKALPDSGMMLAFVRDPDGFRIELIGSQQAPH